MVTTREQAAPPPVRSSGRARKPPTNFNYEDRQAEKAERTNQKKLPKPVKKFVAPRRTKHGRVLTPQYLLDPYTGEQIWMRNATLQDIQVANKKRRPPWPRTRTFLITVPSPKVRNEIYSRHAAALADLETRVLPRFGGRAWSCVVTIYDDNVSPYFVFRDDGSLQIAAFAHVLAKIPDPPRFPGYYSSNSQVGEDDDDDDESTEEEEEADFVDLQELEPDGRSELAMQERSRVPLPTITYKWISPNLKIFTSRKSAWEHAIELCKHEVCIDKLLLGYNANGKEIKLAPHGRKMVMNGGKLRFERDGLWVVGQEEQWALERLANPERKSVPMVSRPKKASGLAHYLKCNRDAHKEKRRKELQAQAQAMAPPVQVPSSPSTPEPTPLNAETSHPDAMSKSVSVVTPPPVTDSDSSATPVKKVSFTVRHAETELRVKWKSLSNEERQKWIDDAKAQAQEKTTDSTGSEGQGAVQNDGVAVPSSPNSVAMKTPADAEPVLDPAVLQKQEEFTKSRKWCLNKDQIRMCYNAGIEHYDQIMHTVTARDLTRELEDGFDLLRERGRGRFDMELPVFETPQYQFLNDIKKAPWMPIVKEILGKDVVLIHKGMFLSMPGAAKQLYHQDGPHLSTQYQKPCHAINVFVPLVDLSLENGPTEFCLGSHILGYEGYNEDNIETPTVKAGTPIIFDYRLGHNGLGNKSANCRPILYCTYAKSADGKEFRDSVNFSRKRYHRIGDLCEKGLSREERAMKRLRANEERGIQAAIDASKTE